MRKLASMLLMVVMAGTVPAIAAAELSMPESCCTPSTGSMATGMSCCEMVSCSMSPRPDPVRGPNHQGTSPDAGKKLSPPQVMASPAESDVATTDQASFTRLAELRDPSPPPTTSVRLAVLSWYLI